MRRPSLIVLLVLAFVLLAGAVGCDKGDATTKDTSPQALVQALLDSQYDIKSAVCPFEIEVQIETDPSKLPEEDMAALMVFKNGLKASGTVSTDSDRQAADVDITLSMSGITYNMGLRMVEQQLFVSMLGQWYDLTPALEQYSADFEDVWTQPDSQEMRDLLTDAGIDPKTWLGEVRLVGQETLGETPVYHLACTPAVDKIIADGIALIQNKDFMARFDPSGELADSLASTEDMPTDAELQEVIDIIPDILPALTLALWADQDDDLLRKMEFSTKLVPTTDMDMDGITSITLDVRMANENINKPVNIKAPENVLPYSSFQQMFGSDFPLPLPSGPATDKPTKS